MHLCMWIVYVLFLCQSRICKNITQKNLLFLLHQAPQTRPLLLKWPLWND
jgi:hypothetical protein